MGGADGTPGWLKHTNNPHRGSQVGLAQHAQQHEPAQQPQQMSQSQQLLQQLTQGAQLSQQQQQQLQLQPQQPHVYEKPNLVMSSAFKFDKAAIMACLS